MDLLLMLVSSIALIGILVFTAMIEIENIKRNKNAKDTELKG